MIEKQAKDNRLKNFTLNLVNGTGEQNLEGTKFKAEKAKLAKPKQKEVNVARILVEHKHSVYFTPENNNTPGIKNPEGIIDGKIAEFKILDSSKIERLAERLLDCDKQNASVAVLHIKNTSGYTKEKAFSTIHEIFDGLYKNEKGQTYYVKNIKEVYLIYGNDLYIIKK